MAIGIRSTPALSASTTDPATSPAIPSGTVAGDLMVLLVGSKAATPPTCATPSGWTAPADGTQTGGTGTAGATTGGPVRATLFWRIFQAGDTEPIIDLSAAGSPTLARILTFTKAAGDVWQAPLCANAADTTGSTTDYTPPTASQTIALAANDWLGVFDMLNDDVGTFTPPGTLTVSGVTLGTVVNRFSTASVAGNDGWVIAETAPYVSGTASAGPVRAVTGSGFIANFSGVSIFFRIRADPPIEKTVPVTAAISTVGLARTVPETAAVQTIDLARTVPLSASTGSSHEILVPAEASLSASPARTVPADAAVQVYVTALVPLSVALEGVFSRTVPTSAVLVSLDLERVVPATADIAPGWLRTVPLRAVVSQYREQTVPVSAAVQRTVPLIAASSMSFGVVAVTTMGFREVA